MPLPCECSTMEDDQETHAVDNRSKWVQSMRSRLETSYDPHPSKKDPFTIYRVPQHIRKSDESAYEPKIISIGPYHRRKEGLHAMEEHKWRYLGQFLDRNTIKCLEKCFDAIKPMEERARSCYSEVVNLNSNDFMEMMVLDGCFLVELFLKQKDKNSNDPIFSTRWMLPLISHDMLLLENQLPFFILERLFQLLEISKEVIYLQQLALEFFRRTLLLWNDKNPRTISVHHLLHLLHSSLLPDKVPPEKSNRNLPNPFMQFQFRKWKNSNKHLLPTSSSISTTSSEGSLPSHRGTLETTQEGRDQLKMKDEEIKLQVGLLGKMLKRAVVVVGILRALKASKRNQPPQPPKSIPGVTELHGAGVKFKRKKEGKNFLEVTFSDGVMKIPHMLIDCNTNSLFRNFIAFEQCYPTSPNHFTSYAFFMDCIVNTPRDVALLGQYKIIEHWLGNDGEVAILFNRLCCGISIDTHNSYLSQLFNQVTEYCKTNWHTWRACLMRDYFSNPWAIISVAAAVVLLLLGVSQTFFSFLSYLRPPPE